ncbi:transcriptional regulator [Kocuria rosea subsp. polaris]|uniref:Transcriptional regulator n=1 Tax=Kocuria rosea subsp. polaris TaxID=136273 RepID=A0A0W8IM77_KOCRO|nr:LCP family protein [Kocuria polaris]KUG61033.1 transcriptional regulator [Kocuria polaris]
MSSSPPDVPARPRARRWSRKRWAAVALVAVLLAVLGAGVAATWRLQSNLDTSPLDLGDGTGPEAGPLDILVMGTDTRDGEGNERYGDEDDSSGSGLTDVMMLVHVNEDRSGVSVVSLPRDLVADIPRCTDPETGEVHPAEEDAMLNSAIANGGPGCTVATVNEMTGLKIDHFMLADFNAVKELSSTVGGVEVCVNEAVDDPKSGLELPAGVSSVEGEQALAFLRSRAAFGDGGDTSRIRSQQSFLASLARKIKDEGTLRDLPRLYEIADVATRNLHVDEGLGSVPTVVGLATAVRGIDLGAMVFVTVPTEPYEADPNRLQLDEEPAEHLFEALREDRPLTSPSAGPTDAPTSSATPSPDAATPVPTVDPATVPLTVANVSGVDGRDAEIADALEDEGYTAVESGPQATELPGTQVFFGAGWYEAAVEVAEVLGVPSSQIVPTTDVTGVFVSVGQDFQEGDRLALGPGLPGEFNGQTAEQHTCQEAAGDW